jgi:hypothetical protein
MEDKLSCLAQAAMYRAVSWQRARSRKAHLLVQGQGSCPRKNASRKVVLQLGDCPGIWCVNAVHSSRIRNSLHTKLHGSDPCVADPCKPDGKPGLPPPACTSPERSVVCATFSGIVCDRMRCDSV